MTEEAFKKAERIKENIDELEDFMFWCSGRREGERKIPARIIVLKRKMIAGLKSKEFTQQEEEKQIDGDQPGKRKACTLPGRRSYKGGKKAV